MTPSYRIDGPAGAPVVMLLNSLGTTWSMWDPQLAALMARFRVLRYDQRGHGATPSTPGPYTIEQLGQDAVDLIDAAGWQRVSLCGLSLGGMVATWLAAHAPDRVDRLVLCCTAPVLPPAEQWTQRAATVRRSGPGVLLEAVLGRWFTSAFLERGPDVARWAAAMLGSCDPEGYAGCCEAIAAMDNQDDLPLITAPTLVIAGAEDQVTPPAIAVAMLARIRGSSLVVLPAAAHLANIEQPERFTAAVVDHLAGSDVERGRQVRRLVLSDEHVDRSDAARTAFTAPFQDLITRYAWGDIWSRPGLDRPTRSCITLAMLVALGRFDELALHVRGARRNGLSADQIGEVLLQTAIYCGVPAANAAFSVASRILADDTELNS
jgi:3-oxoadipate enol-lactonase / 4-carboxymuconolactone decarboxylase